MADSEFARQTLPQLIVKIRADMLARLRADDVLRRQDAEVTARVMAAVSHSILGVIDYYAGNLLPDLCDEEWLVRHASLKKCPRKLPSAARGFVRWDGVADGLTVPAGRLLLDQSGAEYMVTELAASVDGVLRAPIEAGSVGLAGNLDDGAVLQLVSPISGLPSVGAADGMAGGAELEELEAWRARVMARWYWVPHGGAGQDYEDSARSVPGVTRAWFLRHLNGPGTVTVAVAADGELDPIPGEGLLDAVRAEIETWASVVRDELFVIAPLRGELSPSIRLSPDTPEARAAVTAALRDFLFREGGLQREPDGSPTRLELSRLREAISGAVGEFSHELLSPTSSPEFARTELPVLGEIDWGSP